MENLLIELKTKTYMSTEIKKKKKKKINITSVFNKLTASSISFNMAS